LLCFLAIPMATLLALGFAPLAYLHLGRYRPVLPAFAVGRVSVVTCAVVLARTDAFRTVYGHTVTFDFVASTLIGMLALEYFFRGFLLLPNFTELGWWATLVAALPYALVHVGKPLPELVGSVPFALWLSYFAIRTGSVLYGVALHGTLALAINYWAAAGG
jgi:membrane protease YdiL (CAAX protease family)